MFLFKYNVSHNHNLNISNLKHFNGEGEDGQSKNVANVGQEEAFC
jgi:hypothetical protein